MHYERRQRLAHFKRDCLVASLDQLGQFAAVSGPLRRDDADFSQVTAQRVEQPRALRDQHLPRLVTHQRRLVLQRAHADKSHRGPRNRLADRRRVRRVVLLPADIRLHISWRHHARVMAKLDQLARPMMRRPAGLEPHQARRQRSKKLQQLVAPDRLGDHNAPRSINAMNLKHVLGQIEPDGRDGRQIGDRLSHGRRSCKRLLLRQPFWHGPSLSQMPRGRRPHHHANVSAHPVVG